MDLDFALRVDEPPRPADDSNDREARDYYDHWERSNRLSLMLIKSRIARSIRGAIPECATAKEYLQALDKQFKPSDKQMGGTIMSELCSMRLAGVGGMRQHIMKMRDLSSQLKSFKMEVTEQFLVQLILNSLPAQYDAFKVSYNTHKEKWTIDELLAMCVQEETRLLMDGKSAPKEVHLAETSKAKGKKGKKKNKNKNKNIHSPALAKCKKDIKCFFCKKTGHMKNECLKRKAWLEKKGKFLSCAVLESHFVSVSHDTWWIDTGSMVHIATTMQGFLTTRTPRPNEEKVYSGSGIGDTVKAVGTFRIVLSNNFVLDLFETLYVPSYKRNLISICKLIPLGYGINLSKDLMVFSKDNVTIANVIMIDGLFKIVCDSPQCLVVSHGIKRSMINENSAGLWHRRLGHISIDRIKKLTKDGILPSLDYSDLDSCVDCIRGKQTNKSHKGAKRSSELLEIIHTDICCPDLNANGQKYFITFIDDFSRYMHVYLLYNKSEALDAFKEYKAEVEKQIGKPIKIVRSDRGGEYYGRYTSEGQALGPFAEFLREQGIIAQYTMPGSPSMNGVAERRNRTLLDMVRSMMNSSKLSVSLWREALKTATYIVNRVPTKAVSKTPFEIWKGWEPSLNHLKVWGCPAEVRAYNPQEKKLDPKTIRAYFVGYAEKSKGYKFYCPSPLRKFVESRNAKFLENDVISGSDQQLDDHIEQTTNIDEGTSMIHDTPPVRVVIEHVAPTTPVDNAGHEEHIQVQPIIKTQNVIENVPYEQPQPNEEVGLRRSTRERKSALPSDYVVYYTKFDREVIVEDDPLTFA